MSDKPSDKSCLKLQQEFIKCINTLDENIHCKNILQTYLIKCAGKISKEWTLAILATH